MTTIIDPMTREGPALPILATSGADSALLHDARHLSNALSELIRVVQFRDRDRSCCYDISVSQCHALKGIVDADGLTINDLAAHLYLDKSTASRVANGLVEKRLIERKRDEGDGRVVNLVATDEGRATCSRIEDDLAKEYAELLQDFDPDIRPAITKVVARLGRSFATRVDATGGSCCVVRQV